MLGCMNHSRLVAERVIGHPLPPQAEVHHVNGHPRDNRHENLVICQDKAYHRFLHERMRARGYKRPRNRQTYLLRDVDADFWARLKAKADLYDVPLRSLIINLLRQWLGEA